MRTEKDGIYLRDGMNGEFIPLRRVAREALEKIK
jgi:hypothetical protein